MTAKPSAQGTLAKTPFPHLLLYTHGRQLSGTLAVWPDSDQDRSAGQDRVLFQTGAIVAVRPMLAADNAHAALSRLFLRRDAAYGFYEGHNLLGSSPGILVERVDTYTLLARGVRQQPREDLMDAVLGRLRGRALRMRSGVPMDRLELGPRERAFIDMLRAGPASPEELLANADLASLDAKRVLYLLILIRGVEAADGQSVPPPPATESSPVPAQKAPDRMPRMTMGDPSGAVAPRAPDRMPRMTMGDPSPAAPRPAGSPLVEASPSAAGRTTPRAPVSGSVNTSISGSIRPPAPTAPPRLAAPDAARWNELAKTYDRIDDLNHFDLLQVALNAPTADIGTAYFGMVKKFHPDRLPETLAPLVSCAQVLFERITEAHETLSNSETRAEYEKAVAAGGGTRASDRMMRAVLESALEFQKAEVLIKRRDFNQALQLIESALSKNREEGDYHALYAWLLHLMNPGDSAPTDQMLRELDFAIRSNPRSERAHYYKGVILKRLNRLDEATKHFRTASEINPRNVDAVREVRLSNMRKDSKPPQGAPASGKLLSRLFGNTKGDD